VGGVQHYSIGLHFLKARRADCVSFDDFVDFRFGEVGGKDRVEGVRGRRASPGKRFWIPLVVDGVDGFSPRI
jgi:hypothetical protein